MNLVAVRICRSWWVEHGPGLNVKHGTVPGARHGFAFDASIRSGATLMRTRVVQGIELAIEVEQGNALSSRLN